MDSYDTLENDALFTLENVEDALKCGAVIYHDGSPIDVYSKYIFLDIIPKGALEKRKRLLLQAEKDETMKYPPSWYFVTEYLSLEEKWELMDNFELIVVLEKPNGLLAKVTDGGHPQF